MKLPVKKATDLGMLGADEATLKLKSQAIGPLQPQEIGGS